MLDRRKYWDEDYVRNLEEQVRALTALVAASESTRGEISSLGSSFGRHARPDRQSGDTENDKIPSNYTLYPANVDDKCSQEPADAEAISPTALEDLGSLMLRLGIEDQGEPCFTISTGSSNLGRAALPQPKEYRHPRHVSHSDEILRVLHDIALRQHLLECFCLYFNPFHQVFDSSQIQQIRGEDPNLYSADVHMRIVAVLAIGAHLSDLADSDQIGEHCAEYAELLIPKCFKYYPSDYLVQALSLLAWRELILGNDSMSYYFNCKSLLLIRMAHISPSH